MFAIKSFNTFILLDLVLILNFYSISCVSFSNENYFEPNYYSQKEIDYFIPNEPAYRNQQLPAHSNPPPPAQPDASPLRRTRKEPSSSQDEAVNEDVAFEYKDPLKVKVGSSSASIRGDMAEVSIGRTQSAGVGDHGSGILSRDASGAGARTADAHAFADQYDIAEAQVNDHPLKRIFGPRGKDRRFTQLKWHDRGDYRPVNFRSAPQGIVGKDIKYEDLPPNLKAQVDAARAKSKTPNVPEGHEVIAYGDETQVMAVEREEVIKEKQYQRDFEYEEYMKRKTSNKRVPKRKRQRSKPRSFSYDYY